ncbi:30S ribosome-binding factor RbfA [Terrabacter sp. NPDC000476]|uniref:30S ribosome-binding factor RbfA n=1 Tax=Terrabacter sp. NPDC000476 TaxID=3154258 RepID=UPI003332396D
MVDHPRARKVADRIKVIVAEYLEHRIKDERLGFVTITDARVTGDLQHASVFYTVFGSDEERAATAEILEANRGRIRSAVGKGIGIRLTPSLEFIADALPEGAAHLEDLLAQTRLRDEELARAAANAKHAGDADPYRKPVDHDADDEDDVDDDAADAADAADGDAARGQGVDAR